MCAIDPMPRTIKGMCATAFQFSHRSQGVVHPVRAARGFAKMSRTAGATNNQTSLSWLANRSSVSEKSLSLLHFSLSEHIDTVAPRDVPKMFQRLSCRSRLNDRKGCGILCRVQNFLLPAHISRRRKQAHNWKSLPLTSLKRPPAAFWKGREINEGHN